MIAGRGEQSLVTGAAVRRYEITNQGC